MEKKLKNNATEFITEEKKLSQITYYTLKLEELCFKLQKQNNELNHEINTIKKECELQKNQINQLKNKT